MGKILYHVRDFRHAPLIFRGKGTAFVDIRKVHFGSFSFALFRRQEGRDKKKSRPVHGLPHYYKYFSGY